MRPTRTPSSWATLALKAEARSRRPTEVNWNSAASRSAAARTAPAVNRSFAEIPSAVLPILRPVTENAGGNDLTWPP
jgi:hypothetical protein